MAVFARASGPEAPLVADRTSRTRPTPYSATGNWLGWVCLALLAISLIAI
jgi:hypothetical protein